MANTRDCVPESKLYDFRVIDFNQHDESVILKCFTSPPFDTDEHYISIMYMTKYDIVEEDSVVAYCLSRRYIDEHYEIYKTQQQYLQK